MRFKVGDKVNAYYDLSGWSYEVDTVSKVMEDQFYPYSLEGKGGVWGEDHLRPAKNNASAIFEAMQGDGFSSYDRNIIKLLRRQREKGLKKYGETLEQNVTLSREQRIEHLQEELIDGLQYCEHIKAANDSLTVADYQRMAMRTANPECHNPANFALGLAGEAGECADIVKKHLFQGHELDKEHLAEELGDVAWYIALAADTIGISMEEILLRNIEKLRRRYPDGFDKARSISRNVEAEK